jgi:hypothetical protein
MQYAIPNSRVPVETKNTTTVRIGTITPVRAPFPLRKGAFSLGEFQGKFKGRVVLFATISDTGKLEGLRVIRGVQNGVDELAMACLREFAFRPAVRGGKPVVVEALFGIPLD